MTINVRAARAAGMTDTQIASYIEQQQEEKRLHTNQQARVRMQRYRQKEKINHINGHVTLVTRNMRNIEKPNEINDAVTQQMRNKSPHTPLTQSQRIDRSQISREWKPREMNSVMLADQLGLEGQALASEIQSFVDHHLARATEFCDWDAAWRNWLKSPYRTKGKSNGSNLQASACDRRERQAQRWDETLDGLRRFGTGASRTFGGENVTVLSPEGGS